MRLCASKRPLLFLPSLLSVGLALPFKAEDNGQVEHLLRRATYSVVPVDGGSSSTPSDSPVPTTVFQTITKPAVPITTTVIETDVLTLPGTTEVIISVQTIEDTSTAIVTSYSVVDIFTPTVTVTELSVVSPTRSISTSSIVTPSTTSPHGLSSATTVSVTTSSPKLSVTTPIITTSCTSTLTLGTSSEGSISTPHSSIPSTTSHTFDNGQWHTTYSHWSNTTATAASTFRSMATRVVDLPPNSIPIDNSVQGSSAHRGRDLSHSLRAVISNAFGLWKRQS
ncbi:hypothetical protein F5884DRAFT_791335 [Xylogone sp. PMI_703]|nr:hypothetical protein F5884DRAFT_791335 [Xylogone sp. PMI_703]